jgi:hypothetical protein
MMDRYVARNNFPAGHIHETSAETPDPDRKRNKQGNLQLRTCTASGFRERRKYIGVKSQSFCIVYYLTLF